MAIALSYHILSAPEGAKQPATLDDDLRTLIRSEAHRIMCANTTGGYFEDGMELPTGRLFVDATRFGSAVFALWGAGAPPGTHIATTLTLGGTSGDDDVRTLEAFEKHPSIGGLSVEVRNRILAQSRPCVFGVFVDKEQYESGTVIEASVALAVAAMPGSSATSTFMPNKEPAPEEEAKALATVNEITESFVAITNASTKRGRFVYKVKALEPVSYDSDDELRRARFWVGADDDGRVLDAIGLANVFLMCKYHIENAVELKSQRDPRMKHTVDLALPMPVVRKVLSQVQIDD